MEQEHWPRARGTTPQLSRLPMPRASQHNLKLARPSSTPTIHQDDPPKGSHIPQPSKLNLTRVVPPLGESVNTSIKSRYGWNDQSSRPRNRSPVRDALQAASDALETTPPNFNAEPPVFDGNENGGDKPAKRRPRPSLSERTVETLAQMSPSPSPTRRRSSVVNCDGAMGPPARPASSMRSRPESPTKRPFRPPGRSSPTKEPVPVPSPGSIHTPPRAFVKGSKIGRPSSETRRSFSTSVRSVQEPAPTVGSRYGHHTMKAKGGRLPTSKKSHPSLASMFKDPPKTAQKDTLAVSSLEKDVSQLTLQSTNALKRARQDSTPASTTPKSSAALREAIAAAKASRKAPSSNHDDLHLVDNNKGLLTKRIEVGVSTGHLNISAMGLGRIPDEVMRMYEPEGSSIIWSEMVDLTKLNAADNKLEQLGDDIFPDWTFLDNDDDDKYNMFAGLEGIDLHNNLLQNLPLGFRQLERLSRLNLSGNKLTNQSLDLIWQLSNLKELYLANNALSGKLSVESQHLLVLDLHGNQISAFDFSTPNLSSLQTLDVSNNHLSELPWERLAGLSLLELNVANNKLTGILPSFHSLRTLNISHNSIESITHPLELPAIQTLDFSANRLTSIPDVGGCQTLMTLLASNNQLSDFPNGFATLAALKTADFSQNNLKTLNSGICKMGSLSILNLAGNPLRERRYLSMDAADVKLDLEKRYAPTEEGATPIVDSIPLSADKPSARSYAFKPVNGVLDLASQSLATVDLDSVDFSSNEPIHTLRLSNNDLTTLPFDLLSHSSLKYSLKTLNLSHNPHLHPTAYLTDDIFLPSLQSLNVVSTGLTSLDALTTHLKAPALVELNISCHRLTGHVPWVRAYFPSCTTLLATDNWFSSVDVEAVRGLEVLDIRNNEIETLPAKIGLLGNFPSKRSAGGRLKSFECSGNRFRVPRTVVIEKGTEAVMRDLRRMVPADEVPEEWREEL